MYGTIVGDWAVCSGWIARAQTLVDPAVDSAETGWVALNLGMFEADRGRKEDNFREALAVGRRLGDTELEVSALAYLGASRVHDDRDEEGMLLLDEALAAVAGNEVDDFCVLEEVFCQLFSACEHAHDVARADQWIRVGDAIAERRQPSRGVGVLPHPLRRRAHRRRTLAGGRRHAHRGRAAVGSRSPLVPAGRCAGPPRRPAGAPGSLRGGRAAARRDSIADTFHEAARSVAAIHLARGQTALAADVLERALAELDPASTAAAPLMALLVDVHLAAGDGQAATDVADQLLECASRHPANHYLRGVGRAGPREGRPAHR